MESAPAAVEASGEKTILGHPRGLYVLFFTEMWERFSYYGMRSFLVLYMTKFLFYTDSEAGGVYGDYAGFVYITCLFGGFLADRYLGLRRSIILGGIVMAIGQGLLALGFLRQIALFYLGLFLLIIGNGLFKPNISTLVGQLYQPGDARRDRAFTIFYMGINLGAFLSPLVCGTMAEKVNWHWGFALAGIGMVLGILVFVSFKHLLGDRGIRPAHQESLAGQKIEPLSAAEKARLLAVVGIGAAAVIGYEAWDAIQNKSGLPAAVRSTLWPLVGVLVFALWLFLVGRTRGDERRKINAVFLITAFVTVFWAMFEQAGTSLTFFADRSTDLQHNWIASSIDWFMKLLGEGFDKVDASTFQSVNALCIVVFAPLFSLLWGWLYLRKKEPSTPMKMTLGIFFNAISFVIMIAAALRAAGGQKVSVNWLLIAYTFQTFGELSLSPIGLSMVTKLAPARFGAMIMGVWFLSNGIGNKLSGVGGGLYSDVATHKLFGVFALILGIAGVILLCLVPYLKRLMGNVK
jgi:proton-dependent oligopeptide transporter, POT family